jgi:hypothetical protein
VIYAFAEAESTDDVAVRHAPTMRADDARVAMRDARDVDLLTAAAFTVSTPPAAAS